MKSNFNIHKYFKNQYLYEGMSDEEIHAIKRYEELTDDDKLKLAKIQAMMDREKELREEGGIEAELKKNKGKTWDDAEPAQVTKEKGIAEEDMQDVEGYKMKYIEDLADAAEEAYDAGMDVDEILKFIEQHLGLKFGDY
jgi:hypothetical protein